MKRTGLINGQLTRALAGLRHTDLFAVSDSGLPVPGGVEVIDLGVVYGIPDFLTVLRPVLAEVTVEAAWASRDVADVNPDVHRALADLVGPQLLAHEDFKERLAQCRFVVRTGDATPYANVLLRAGVAW
ncbi:D-ribose pyranase [Amycolatopsis sp. NEAU-NG30]|uniref:D-ribose pyranase n=1 Tax=Amycolatopsis melonis TaxID=3156488 RepID=A0ABV0LQR8_9PSEU